MKIRHLMIGTAAALSLGAAANATTTVTVDAITPIGSWLDTGLSLNPGTTYDFTVNNPATIWSAGATAARDSTADGIPLSAGFGTLTMDGFTAKFGALVGEVGPVPGGGSGDTFFLIGTGPISLTGLSGELYVGYWDSFYGDNSGTQSLSISSVPEPATWALILAGFAGLGAAMRSARRRAYA